MKIDLPQLHNFDKNKLAPYKDKIASFTVDAMPARITKPFMFISTSKLALYYQKLRDRYEYLRRLEPMTPCDPKCPEGKYFDCETETCKDYPYEGYFTTGLVDYSISFRHLKYTLQGNCTYSMETLDENTIEATEQCIEDILQVNGFEVLTDAKGYYFWYWPPSATVDVGGTEEVIGLMESFEENILIEGWNSRYSSLHTVGPITWCNGKKSTYSTTGWITNCAIKWRVERRLGMSSSDIRKIDYGV